MKMAPYEKRTMPFSKVNVSEIRNDQFIKFGDRINGVYSFTIL